MFDLPGGSSPFRIRTDPVHTYHIGYGKDENASIIMVLVQVGHFGTRGSVDKKLETAFERYATYCKINRKHTSITEFSKKQFKISAGSPIWVYDHFVISIPASYFGLLVSHLWSLAVFPCRGPLRGKSYPRGGGKGHDTAVLGSWLEHELASAELGGLAFRMHPSSHDRMTTPPTPKYT